MENSKFTILGTGWLILFLLIGCTQENPFDPDYKVSTPSNLSATQSDDGLIDRIELQWEIPENDDLYCNIYREPGITTPYRELINTSNAHFYIDDSDLVPDQPYSYFVEPVGYYYQVGELSAEVNGYIALYNRLQLNSGYLSLSVDHSTGGDPYNYIWYALYDYNKNSYEFTWIDADSTADPSYSDIEVAVYIPGSDVDILDGETGPSAEVEFLNDFLFLRIGVLDNPAGYIKYDLSITPL